MLEILFGWRNASKCKKLLRKVQCRLKLLKNKRGSIVRQLRDDIGQLLRTGHEQIAYSRVDQLIHDESIATVYHLLDHFCEFIVINVRYIRKKRACPNDVNEAVSSLVFASARCGDLPELRSVRKLFENRYGKKFVTDAVELLPGNLVNCQLKEKLSPRPVPVPDQIKRRLVDEIARDYCFLSVPLALEYSSEVQQHQVKEVNVKEPKIEEIEQETSYIDIPLQRVMTESPQRRANKYTGENVHFASANEIEECGNNSARMCTNGNTNFDAFEHEQEISTVAFGKDSRFQFPQQTVIYFDDIEEIKSSIKDGNCHDQRMFIFKSFFVPRRRIFKDVENGKYEGRNGTTSSWSSGSSKAPKTLRNRSVDLESQTMKDVEFTSYYGGLNRGSPNQNSRSECKKKHRKKTLVDENWLKHLPLCNDTQPRKLSYWQRRPTKDEKKIRCSFDNPGYFTATDDIDSSKTPKLKHDQGAPEWLKLSNFVNSEELQEDNVRHSRSVQTDSKGLHSSVSSNTSCSRVSTSPWAGEENQTPCLRAMTMPPERPKDNERAIMSRSISVPLQQLCPSNNGILLTSPSHVHPKLPDYSELEAKFTALRKAHLQKYSPTLKI